MVCGLFVHNLPQGFPCFIKSLEKNIDKGKILCDLLCMGSEEETLLWMILNALPEVGPVTFRRLKERFNGKICHIFSASYEELTSIGGVSRVAAEHIVHWEKYFDWEQEQRQLSAINAKFITQKDKNYPLLLREIYDAPIGLYVKGNLDLSRNNYIAMVGTRKATIYGLRIARDFARELASLGFIIVGGMALGIDSAAHEGALSVEGKVAENNGILSEFPSFCSETFVHFDDTNEMDQKTGDKTKNT
jgi:predicted Rossmann fold nucleotide-binding protein DprA/Smf involved in DNA uptake